MRERERSQERDPLASHPRRAGGFTADGDWDERADWNLPRRRFVQRLVDMRRSDRCLPPAAVAQVILERDNAFFRGMFPEETLIEWLALSEFDDWQQLVPLPDSGSENAACATVRLCGNSGAGQEQCVWYRGWYKPPRFFGGRRDAPATDEDAAGALPVVARAAADDNLAGEDLFTSLEGGS